MLMRGLAEVGFNDAGDMGAAYVLGTTKRYASNMTCTIMLAVMSRSLMVESEDDFMYGN